MEQLDFKIFEVFIGKYPGNFSDLLFFIIHYIKSIKQIQLQYLKKEIGKHVILLKLFYR